VKEKNLGIFSEIYQMKPEKDKLHKMTVGKQREKQVEQGFFDGRFVQRAEESKKVFKRKEKHPKKDGEK
jgi:hypothetical protein